VETFAGRGGNGFLSGVPVLNRTTVWSDFTFQVGSGSAIQGFDEGVRGMRVGESRRLVVPPEKGYGPLDSTLVFERPLLWNCLRLELDAHGPYRRASRSLG